MVAYMMVNGQQTGEKVLVNWSMEMVINMMAIGIWMTLAGRVPTALKMVKPTRGNGKPVSGMATLYTTLKALKKPI